MKVKDFKEICNKEKLFDDVKFYLYDSDDNISYDIGWIIIHENKIILGVSKE